MVPEELDSTSLPPYLWRVAWRAMHVNNIVCKRAAIVFSLDFIPKRCIFRATLEATTMSSI
jgi:hypothetical protein